MSDVKIIINNEVFNRDKERAKLSDRKRQYNSDIAQMNKAVEELDRFDDFATLKIPISEYKKGKGEYGIEPLSVTDKVIFPHQETAAIEFLKDLRGFGLLADVVGSGKTFEAGVVLSELAARNKIRSLLFVVPEQVYSSWVDVIEHKFGMGDGVLVRVGSDPREQVESLPFEMLESGAIRPLKPIIVTMEDFAMWPDSCGQWMFDAIVVDEAHHLCVEEGRYANVMKLLSLMMQTKQVENVTYCLLLSATPHSGNLEHMFRLWYFIRCKGGNPSDFEVKEDIQRTAAYRSEKEYYKRHICRGASTVMEFIKKVKLIEVTGEGSYYLEKFRAWLKARRITSKEYSAMNEGEISNLIDEFLNENDSIRDEVIKRVASAYHNGVLRPIMIRQPNELARRRKKRVVNYLFYPTDKVIGEIDTTGLDGERLHINAGDLYGAEAVTVAKGSARERSISLPEYIKEVKGDYRLYNDAMAEMIVSKTLSQLEPDDSSQIFVKKHSIQYYWDQMAYMPEDVETYVQPISHNEEDRFAHKYIKTLELLREHREERVIIFFDYDSVKARERSTADELLDRLNSEADIKDRLIVATKIDKVGTERAFNDKKDAILIVTTADFTEGVNLQKSSVIINYEVTPDPLAMDQRVGRVFRMGQTRDVTVYSLADMNQLEGYVLMYFARIGLLSSNSGDATIIAGSNNERMVTVRCRICGNVKLLSQDDYEKEKKKLESGEDSALYCKVIKGRCIGEIDCDSEYGTVMDEISVYDFKCNNCGSVFTRSVSQEGYLCMAVNNTGRGIMCNSGEAGDRQIYCRKICAISHCRRFVSGELRGLCEALKAYNKNKNIADSKLMELCESCENKSLCMSKCRVGVGIDAIRSCRTCDEAICRPAPHVIEFDDKWSAKCPVCEANGDRGKITPIIARTFATYIRSAWDFKHDKGEGFCKNLGKEANKTALIKQILKYDKLDK